MRDDEPLFRQLLLIGSRLLPREESTIAVNSKRLSLGSVLSLGLSLETCTAETCRDCRGLFLETPYTFSELLTKYFRGTSTLPCMQLLSWEIPAT